MFYSRSTNNHQTIKPERYFYFPTRLTKKCCVVWPFFTTSQSGFLIFVPLSHLDTQNSNCPFSIVFDDLHASSFIGLFRKKKKQLLPLVFQMTKLADQENWKQHTSRVFNCAIFLFGGTMIVYRSVWLSKIRIFLPRPLQTSHYHFSTKYF